MPRYQNPASGYATDTRRRVESQARAAEIKSALRTELPTSPCYKCEARGWCEHRKPEE